LAHPRKLDAFFNHRPKYCRGHPRALIPKPSATGGIPERSLLSPVKTQAQLAADIGSVPAYLPHPDPGGEGGNALAWDLMWNDPAPIQNKLKKDGEAGAGGCGEEQRVQVEREEMATPSGFGPNLARGTAHVFTAQGLELFLNDYGLTHLVSFQPSVAHGILNHHVRQGSNLSGQGLMVYGLGSNPPKSLSLVPAHLIGPFPPFRDYFLRKF